MMDKVKLQYVGNGTFVIGVPARDLSANDIKQLDSDQIKAALASGLYIELSDKKKESKDGK